MEPSSLDDSIARTIVDAAFQVHRTLGAGLLERIYEACLKHEIEKRGISTHRQLSVPVEYDGLNFDDGYTLDLLVGDRIIVELKAVEKLLPIHEAQLLTYLKLKGLRLGLLINFNVPLIKDGIRRIIRSESR